MRDTTLHNRIMQHRAVWHSIPRKQSAQTACSKNRPMVPDALDADESHARQYLHILLSVVTLGCTPLASHPQACPPGEASALATGNSVPGGAFRVAT